MIIVLGLLLAGAGGWYWQQAWRARTRAPGAGAGAGTEQETIEDAPWWPVVLAIERDSDDPALAFQARTAWLAWYSIPALGRHPVSGGIEFTSLWRNRTGHWFYVDAVVTGAARGTYTLVLPVTARRAYDTLLAEPVLLAREFPDGCPAEAASPVGPERRGGVAPTGPVVPPDLS